MTGFFSSYIQSIAALGICAFICEFICSCGKGSENIKRTVGFIASLCIFITVIVPFLSGLKEMLSSFMVQSDVNENMSTETEDNSFYSLVAQETEKKVSEDIFNKFGINPLDVSIELGEREGVIELVGMTVTLKNENKDNREELEKNLKESGFENINVKIGENADEKS